MLEYVTLPTPLKQSYGNKAKGYGERMVAQEGGKIVLGFASHYFLPVYNARTINPEYHNHLLHCKLIWQTIAIVTKIATENSSAKGWSYLATVTIAMAQNEFYLSNHC